MFKSIVKFFKRLFGDNKVLIEFIVKDTALRVFQKRTQIAVETLKWLDSIDRAMTSDTIKTIQDAVEKAQELTDKMKLTVEEKVMFSTLMTTIVNNLKDEIAKTGITDELKKLSKFEEFLGWIRWSALQATKEK
jgi:hypothetical protein